MLFSRKFLRIKTLVGSCDRSRGRKNFNFFLKIIFLAKSIYLARNFYGGQLAASRFILGTFRRYGLTGLKALLREIYIRSLPNQDQSRYEEFIKLTELQTADYSDVREKIQKFRIQPKISVVLPTYNPVNQWLKAAIESLKCQPYENWELCIADDASTDLHLKEFLSSEQALDSRIKLIYRESNGHISAASNSAASLATGDWIALFDHDDLLHPFAFFWIVTAINENPKVQLIYSDEDKVDESGNRHSPYFKSDWNYDLFLSQNCFSHLGLIKRSLFEKVGGFRTGYEGSQDHDLILRAIEHTNPSEIVHIPKILYHWRVHDNSTAKSADSKPYAAIAGEKAITDHFHRMCINASVTFEDYGYRVKYELPKEPPLVSLIIPTRNGLNLLRQCIDSILQRTLYSNFEFIIVDNGSDQPDVLDYLEGLKNNARFKIIHDERPFNFSQLNNMAVRHSSGDIIGLINNDIEVISPEWLGEMVSHALRPGIGAVGAKLLYPDGRIQHGGVILGVGGVANHAHLFLDQAHSGYFSRARVTQQLSAVTAACLLVKKSIFLAVNGLDEENLAVAFNDVDFCLRIGELGYRNIWTPYALLYHHESATRGQDFSPEKRARFVREVEYMKFKWQMELSADPFYNPNLNIDFPDFSLHAVPRVDKWFSGITVPIPRVRRID